jgi:membrane protein
MFTPARLLLLAKQSAAEFRRDHCSHLAAGIAYYALFSIFPLLIFVTGITGLVLRDAELQARLVDAILDTVPLAEDEGRGDVVRIVGDTAQESSGAIGIAGLLVAAWSATSMFGAIRRSINLAYDLETYRPLLRQKLVDFGLLLALAPFFLLSIVVTGLVAFTRGLFAEVPVAAVAADHPLAWEVAGLALSAGLSFLAFLVLYWIVPAADVHLRDAWPGALAAALLFETAKAGFGIYLRNFASYDVVFGTLAAAAAFLFWVYVSANILLLGAELAAEYPRVRRGERDRLAPKVARSLTEQLRAGLRGLVKRS